MRRAGGRALHPVAAASQERFTTTDGVELGLVRWGSGSGSAESAPPLLLVHGGVTAYQCFDPVVPALAAGREIVAFDRRGRGLSGDGDASVEREAADIVEVAAYVAAGAGDGDAGGGLVDVLGYSYGGMLLLHALRHEAVPIRKAVVYEPPFGVPGMPPPGVGERVVGLAEEGRHDEAVRAFVSGTFLLPDPVVDAMARHPMWQVSLDAAATIPREFRALAGVSVPAGVGADVPVLVIVQSESAPLPGNPAFRAIAAEIERTRPNAEVAYVNGLPHFAMSTDADAFVGHVEAFLASGRR